MSLSLFVPPTPLESASGPLVLSLTFTAARSSFYPWLSCTNVGIILSAPDVVYHLYHLASDTAPSHIVLRASNHMFRLQSTRLVSCFFSSAAVHALTLYVAICWPRSSESHESFHQMMSAAGFKQARPSTCAKGVVRFVPQACTVTMSASALDRTSSSDRYGDL